MKKFSAFCILIFLTFGLQGLTLINEEDSQFYFLTVEADVIVEDGRLSRLGIESFLDEQSEAFRRIFPRSTRQIDVETYENPLLIGVYENSGMVARFPVIVVSLTPGSVLTTGRSLRISRNDILTDIEGEPLLLLASRLDLPVYPLSIDQAFTDWLSIPELVEFSSYFTPPVTTLEQSGEIVPIEDSARQISVEPESLSYIKALKTSEGTFFLLSTTGEIDPETTWLLYYYGDGEEENRILFEVPAAVTSGPVLLWESGSSAPKDAGRFSRGYYFIEWMITADQLTEDLLSSGRFELTSYRTDVDVEGARCLVEFFYSDFQGSDIPGGG